MYDAGGVLLPSTVTGGSKGPGTLNTQGIYVNGDAMQAVDNSVVPGYVLYEGTGVITGNAGFFWDSVNNRLVMPGALINGGTGAGSVGDLAMTGSGANGVNLKMTGNTSLSKTFRVLNGHLQIMSNGYTSLFDLDDSGFLTLQPGTAIPVTGTADLGVLFSSTADFGITYLSGTPNITMARGTLALMNGAGGMPWVNTDGTPSGWVQLAPSVAGGYLPLSGGTVTGPVTFQGALTMPDGSTWDTNGISMAAGKNVVLSSTSQMQIVNGVSLGWTAPATLEAAATGSIGFAPSGDVTVAMDTFWTRDAAGIMAQRNGVTAQQTNIYGTYTNSTNFRRLEIAGYSSGRAAASIITNWQGTGTAYPLDIGSGTAQWQWTTAGHYVALTDNTFDIGTTGARPRNLFLGGSATLGASSGLTWAGRAFMQSPADGQVLATTQAGNVGTLLDFATDGVTKFRNRTNTADAVTQFKTQPNGTNDNTGATTAFVQTAVSLAVQITAGTTPPVSPTTNELWFNTDASSGGGGLYVYYNDGNTSQWVPTTPGVGALGLAPSTYDRSTTAQSDGGTYPVAAPMTSTQGTQVFTRTFTANNPNNAVEVDVTLFMGAGGVAINTYAGVFVDGGSAVQMGIATCNSQWLQVLRIVYRAVVSPGAHTYSVRFGANSGCYVLRNDGTNYGTLIGVANTMTIREVPI